MLHYIPEENYLLKKDEVIGVVFKALHKQIDRISTTKWYLVTILQDISYIKKKLHSQYGKIWKIYNSPINIMTI